MKINLGSGQQTLTGYLNLDIKGKGEGYIDMNEPLDLPSGSVDEILMVHSFEHIKTWSLEEVVKSIHRVLKKGGKLIIEVPNLRVLCRKYLDGNAMMLEWIYGNQGDETEVHYWGWDRKSLVEYLKVFGFEYVNDEPPQDETRPAELSFRVVAIK